MTSQPVLFSVPDHYKAKELVDWVKENWGSTQEDWIREGKFHLVFVKIAPLQGLIGPYQNKLASKYHFRLSIDESLNEDDRRFVIAHEIAHSFFYSGEPKHRTIPTSSWNKKRETNPEEQWCDFFAEELTNLKPPPIQKPLSGVLL